MPRYGDLDALMEVIREHDYPLVDKHNSQDCGMFTAGIQQAVDELPTADVVEVRCKDCAFWTYEGVGSSTLKRFGSCAKWYPFGNEQHNCHDDDFCSCGERRNDE